MKVLRIIPSMDPSSGGPCQGLRNIIPELEKLGIQNEVICLDDPSAPFIGTDSFTVHSLGPAKGPWRYSDRLIPWLVDNLERFDVVIVHALWLYHGYALRKAVQKINRTNKSADKINLPRIYIMPHGMLDPYFQKTEERKLKALRNWVYWKFIESKVVNNSDGLLFTCQAELMLAREPFRPYHPQKEINIGYGVEAPPPFSETMRAAFLEKCDEVKDQPFILFLSRIHEKKGVDHLLEAYAKIKHRTKATNGVNALPKLVIAGPGMDTPYGEKMQAMVQETASLNGSVFFPGMLTSEAKWGAFYGCDAFVLPSHQENFGIAVAEALACSKPVLISDQVNIWNEIIKSGAGIVSKDNTEGVELLLNSWCSLPISAREEMGELALACYQKDFAVKPAAERFCEMILT
ncbi:MAG: glycosyltransferase [Ferruginibacter sp.]